MNGDEAYIGSGWGFPPTFDKSGHGVELQSGKEDIDDSLHLLLSTTIGERIMQPRYGCNLKQFLFEPVTASLQPHIKKLVGDAILYFEPRIRLEEIELAVNQGRMEITLEYTIRTSNTRSNFVFPFYQIERTEP